MTNQVDKDLGNWVKLWQSAGDDALPSLDAIRREARLYVWTGIGSIGVGLILISVFTTWAFLDPAPTLIVAAIVVWMFVLGSIGLDLWNRRGTWRAIEPSTREFVALARRQLTARLRGFQLGWGLLVAEAAFFIPWIAWVVIGRENVTLESFVRPYLLLAAMLIGFGVALAYLQRRARRQLNRVLDLERSLSEEKVG